MNYTKKILNKRAMGELIRLEMKNQEITFEDLAFNLNLNSPRVIYEWINGTKLPKLENFVNLCLIFNVDFKDFIVFL